jgi:VCBS repeat-containing protein
VATGSNGIATVNDWTLGPVAGPNTLEASVPSAPGAGTEEFTATGTAVNQAPTAQDDSDPAYTVDEDGTLNITAEAERVLSNDLDPDGDNLTAVNASDPAGGTVILDTNGSFTYTPDPDFNGTDTFTYQASDGQALSNTATVTITVNPVNDDPGLTIGGDVTTSSLISSILGESHAGWASGISPGPPNESSQTVDLEISTDADDAFQTTPLIDAAGNLIYQPFLRFDTILVNATIVAEDSGGATSTPQTFTITITP